MARWLWHGPASDIVFSADGGFYLVDPGNFRILQFDRNRTLVRSSGAFGTGNGQFVSPLSVALDDQGPVYIGDDSRDDVQVFTADGTFVRTIGTGHGDGPVQLNNISEALVVGDRLIVADFDNDRIATFALDGTFLEVWEWEKSYNPASVAVGPGGELYVTWMISKEIMLLAADGRQLAVWSPANGRLPT